MIERDENNERFVVDSQAPIYNLYRPWTEAIINNNETNVLSESSAMSRWLSPRTTISQNG